MRKLVLATVLGLVLIGTACGESGKDAGVDQRISGKRTVFNMPDEFPNIAAICLYGHLVLETTQNNNSKAFSDTPNDPSCRGRHGVSPAWQR